MDASGEPVGGIVGFLKGLQLLIERYSPSDLIVVWEGGGSKKRRGIEGTYKGGRKPTRMNRFHEYGDHDSGSNRDSQLSKLISLLRLSGVRQIYVSDCEADDVIAYLSNAKRDEDVVIVSTDKDYYQLIDDRISVWSPASKKSRDVESIIEEFGVHPNNFCLARCFVGDKSDNLPGVPGAGFKSLVKRFPAFKTKDSLAVDDILRQCNDLKEQSKIKLYNSILDSEDLLKKNWKLMYLGFGKLAGSQVEKIQGALDVEIKRNKLEFIRELIKIRIDSLDYDKLFMSLKTLG